MKKHNGIFRLKWIALVWIVGFAPLILALRLLNNILFVDQAIVAFAAYLILPAVIAAGWFVVALVGLLPGRPARRRRNIWAEDFPTFDNYGNRTNW